MEAGVAFFLLFILFVIAAGAAVFFYLGGAVMWLKKPDPEAGEDQSRPKHVETGPATNARFVPSMDGTDDRSETRSES
jgi:hypothetical protein